MSRWQKFCFFFCIHHWIAREICLEGTFSQAMVICKWLKGVSL